MEDKHRYVWLLANMGRVESHARNWRPGYDKPLLNYLQDFIDLEVQKEGDAWFERQIELLNAHPQSKEEGTMCTDREDKMKSALQEIAEMKIPYCDADDVAHSMRDIARDALNDKCGDES